MLLTLSSCSATERLNRAASTQGQTAAGVILPALPEDCRKPEPHASIQIGSELRSVLVRERGQLDKANARVGRCSTFYDDIKTKYGSRP